MTTVSRPSWQRQQHARRIAKRRSANAAGVVILGVTVIAFGVAVALFVSPLLGAIVATAGTLAVLAVALG